MQERIAYVFIDEYGTPDLDITKSGNEPYFIYTAVVVSEKNMQLARNVLNELYSKYYRQGYIKSSRIKNDEKGYLLTIQTLTELSALNHYVSALVIDKEHVTSEGLGYKCSFIKYFQRLFSKRFIELYDEVHVRFDKTGSEDFKLSLMSYMENNAGFDSNLFSNNTFEALDDQTEEPLIQLADFYSGVIGRYYCGKYDENKANVIYDNFVRSRIFIEWFPSNYASWFAAESSFDGAFDRELLELAIKSANSYVESSRNDDVGKELLRYMIQEASRNPLRHISSKEIKEYLHRMGYEIGDPIVKISELRDNEVLIISPIGKKGYKFPVSEIEIAEFYNRLSTNVIPQLRRGYIINKLLLEKTMGRMNVMGKPDFELLLTLCDEVVKKNKNK